MATKRDYYEILGVGRETPKDEIKRAYRKLALQYHPDKNKDPGAEDRFKEISEAYAVLSDDEKRRLYDQFGHAGVDQRYSQEDIFRGADFGDFGDIFGSIFGSIFGGGFGRGARPDEGRDLGVEVTLSLEEAFRGTKREVRYERQAPCDACQGSGAAPGSDVSTCGDCRGRGQVQRAQRTILGSFVQVTTCPTCRGSGRTVERACTTCRGVGHARTRRTVEVNIPAGVDDNDRLRLPGEGDMVARGGRAGDLYVIVRVAGDKRFARDGADLLTAIPVDYPTLVLGGSVSVPTLEGELEVDVPAGSRPGQRLRVAGHGMPRRGSRGDLYIQLELHVPSKPSRRERELLEQLRAAHGEEESGWFGIRKRKTK